MPDTRGQAIRHEITQQQSVTYTLRHAQMTIQIRRQYAESTATERRKTTDHDDNTSV